MATKPLEDVVQGQTSQEVQFLSQANLVLHNLNGRNGVIWGSVAQVCKKSPEQHLLTVLMSIPFNYLHCLKQIL